MSQHIMQPFIVCISEKLNLQISHHSYQSRPVAHKLHSFYHPADGRRLSWAELTLV